METKNEILADTTHAQDELRKIKSLIAVYCAFSGVVLVVVVILSVMGDAVSGFMWGRSAGMLTSALAAYWLTGLAQGGSRPAYPRVRIISVVVPIAVLALDSIPGPSRCGSPHCRSRAPSPPPTAFIANRRSRAQPSQRTQASNGHEKSSEADRSAKMNRANRPRPGIRERSGRRVSPW